MIDLSTYCNLNKNSKRLYWRVEIDKLILKFICKCKIPEMMKRTFITNNWEDLYSWTSRLLENYDNHDNVVLVSG